MARVLVALLSVVALVHGQNVQVDETSRGGQGHSQQYHYQSAPEAPAYAGLSFDLTLLPAAIGAIILLLAFSALIYPLLKSGHSSGWDSGWSRSSKSQTADMTQKVLNGIEKLYTAYNKMQ